MRVLLVDDHELVFSGTRSLLERVLAEEQPPQALALVTARSLAEGMAQPPAAFDLVLLDYHLPDGAGLPALSAMRSHFENTPVCVLSAERDPRRVRSVVEAGAAGFLPKGYSMQEMEAALRVVLRQKVYLPAEFVLAADASRDSEADEVPSPELAAFVANELSPRQRDVLARAMRGLPTKLIARELGIAEGTVKAHLSMVYRALGVRNRTDALCRLFQAGATGVLQSS